MKRQRRYTERKGSICVAAALILPVLLMSLGGIAYANFASSSQLICSANINSGSPAIEIAGWIIQSTNTIDANGNSVVIGDELKIESVIDGEGKVKGLNITADPIVPDWYLDLTVDILNMLESIPVRLNRTIFYFNETINDWVETDIPGLHDFCGIAYSDAWYNATSGDPIPDITTHDVYPCQTVRILESLSLAGEDYLEVQGQAFSFLIVITATYPETNGNGGG
jgi:hypothetical protein